MGRLHYAARRGMLDVLEAALASGEPVDTVSLNGFTALHIASQEGFTKMIRVLLDAGADPRIPHPNGRTALHFAAGGGRLNATIELVQSGVPVDIKTGDGATPALEAAEVNDRHVVDYLVRQGADPNAFSRREEGMTVARWLEVGGVQGQHASFVMPKVEGTPKGVEIIRGLMEKAPSVEEYAARYGRGFLLFSYGSLRLSDPEAERWAKRFSEIIGSAALLAECEDRFLDGEELAERHRLRDRQERASTRRRERDRIREERRLSLT